MKISAIIVAGGRGRRMGADINKVFLPLCGKEILAHTLTAFEACDKINETVVVTAADDISRVKDIVKRSMLQKVTKIIEGGAERQNSVYNGLCAATGEFAVIHDGARCLITPEEISAVIADAIKYGASAIGVTVKDTLKSIDELGSITGTIDRDHTVQIQTPQVFPTDVIKTMHEDISARGITVTDDCSIYEYFGKTVHVTIGSYDNIKLTTPEDISIGEQIIERRGKQK